MNALRRCIVCQLHFSSRLSVFRQRVYIGFIADCHATFTACVYILNKIQRFIYDEGQTMKVIANVLNSFQEIQSLAFERLTLRSNQNCFLNYKSKSCNRFFVGHKTLALATNCILNVKCRYTVASINRFQSHFIRCLYLIMYIADAGEEQCIKELFTLFF